MLGQPTARRLPPPAIDIRAARAPRGTGTRPAGRTAPRTGTASAPRARARSSIQPTISATSGHPDRADHDDAPGDARHHVARIVGAPHRRAHRQHAGPQHARHQHRDTASAAGRRRAIGASATRPTATAKAACRLTSTPTRARPCARLAHAKLKILASAGAPLTTATAKFTQCGEHQARVALLDQHRDGAALDQARWRCRAVPTATPRGRTWPRPRGLGLAARVSQISRGSTHTERAVPALRRPAAGRDDPWDSRRTDRRAASRASR